MNRQRVVVIGLGRWGKNLVRNFSELGALYGVADVNSQLRAEFSNQYSVQAMTVSEVMADSSVSAVAIATPVAQHHSIASAALSAGKHVWIEKPVCFSAAECQELLALSQEQGCCVFVDYLPVYHPAITTLKHLLIQNVKERKLMIEAQRKAWGVWREEGVIWDLMCHDLAMIKYLFPDLKLQITRFDGGQFYDHSQYPDYAKVSIISDQCEVVIEASCVNPIKTQQLYVSLGDKAYLFDAQAPLQNALSVFHLEHQPMKFEQEFISYDYAEPLRTAVEHFLQCIEMGTLPITDLKFALNIENFIRQIHQELE